MGINGVLELTDIGGESKKADFDDLIDIHGAHWTVDQKSGAVIGSGLTQSRAEIGNFHFLKWFDASSPDIIKKCMSGGTVDEAKFTALKDSGDKRLPYLIITMTNCLVSKYSLVNDGSDGDKQLLLEDISIACEKINVKYTKQEADGSGGTEYEQEYDIVKGE